MRISVDFTRFIAITFAADNEVSGIFLRRGGKCHQINMTNNIGTPRTQVILDYDDVTRMMDEMADKVAARLQALTPTPAGEDDKELLTPKKVRKLFAVTDKTLYMWHKSGFLPRIRIGGVVRYRRADVERAAKVKGK